MKNGEARGICRNVCKSIKVAFGNIFLDDFHTRLENPVGFSTATTGPAKLFL
jgi:hypothetical protein